MNSVLGVYQDSRDERNIEFMYSSRQGALVNGLILDRIKLVMDRGQFIMGREVTELENVLAEFSGAKHAIGCANGTDALTLALLALKLRPNDVVFVPAFTYSATPETICLLGGRPYFVDVEADGFNICPDSLEESVRLAQVQGLSVTGIITVDLFGRACNYDAVKTIAHKYGLFHISDAAQSFGATYRNKRIGGLAHITTTSFFPTKPLGCYGDGGMLFTNDDNTAALLRSLTQHGKGDDKYNIIRIGMNSRLDTIQAAVLLEKFKIFPGEIKKRQELAQYYNECTGQISNSEESVWAVYSMLHSKRDQIIKALRARGIPSGIYYPLPLHHQPAYREALRAAELRNAERYAKEIFALPMHAYITLEEREYIVNNLEKIFGNV